MKQNNELCKGCQLSYDCHGPKTRYLGKEYICPCATCIVKVTCQEDVICESYITFKKKLPSPSSLNAYYNNNFKGINDG